MINQDFYNKLAEIVSEEAILENEPMSKHTTFRIGGNAEVFVSPKISQVADILKLAKEYEVPVTIIGNGSNLLVGDKGISGLVLSFGKDAEEIQVDGSCMIVSAGALLSKIAAEAAKRSLTGFEFAAGIPGTLGGAIVMNAGAYGGEIKDTLVSSLILDENLEIRTLTAEEHELSYRHSVFHEQPGWIVLETTFSLTPASRDELHAKTVELLKKRNEKQPLEYPNAGSTFKRPEGYFAGKLIEDAGLRGFSVGDAQVSEKHCGFVINQKNATAKDVCDLIDKVRETVAKQFGVTLEAEVRYVKRNEPDARL